MEDRIMLPLSHELSQVIEWSGNESYYNFSSVSIVPSLYIVTHDWKETRPQEAEEMTDHELVKLAERCGSFDFLDDPDEDIYDLSDGTALC
jgi:hypothetical protein